jgi:cytochrome c oxidase cbb3-type subunit 3
MAGNEKDQLLGHGADNDGIDEYDNPLPDWWLALFYFSILFAIGYTIEYHWVSHRSQAGAYDAEVAAAKVRWPQADAPVVAAVTPEAVAAGQGIYQQNCVACHGADLHGGIGPDLTDGTWIHGGTLPDITNTITKGVPEKGMITWGPILGPEKVGQVAAFVFQSSHPN